MNKKILLIGLIVTVITMSIGYALYSTSLKVKGSGSIDSNFNIEVTNINEDYKCGKAVSITNPTYTKTSASFNTKLSGEKDSIEYKVELTNKGSIDGKIENIEIINPNEIIKVETRGIEKGQIIKAGEVKEYIVRVCIPEGTKVNQDVTSKIEVNTEITQDDNQIFNEPEGGIEANKLEIESTIEESDYTSITGTVNAKGNGLKYSYSLDGESYTDPIESNTYTFNNLTPGKRYTVYYKVEDKDGNYVTESKWIETKTDNNAPECILEVKEITLDNIKIKATCTDETEIVKYELSDDGGLFKDKNKETEYSIDPFSPSLVKIKVTDLAGNSNTYSLSDEVLQNVYQNVYELINNKYNALIEKESSYNNTFLNKTYPIGSIYITTTNVNPKDEIGGTWEAYGTGRSLVGVNTSDSNFNTVGKTGGTINRTLAITNMAGHTHSIPALSGTAASAGSHNHKFLYKGIDEYPGYPYSKTLGNWVNFFLGNSNNSSSLTTIADAGAHTHNVTVNSGTSAKATGSNGSGSSFTNLPPYITVYMWKRIS